MSNGLGAGDSLKNSDTFRFFRGANDPNSPGRRDVRLSDLKTYLEAEGFSTGGGGGDASDADVKRLEENLAVNTIRDQVGAGWSYLGMVDGVSDTFTDETGVDSTPTTAAYNAANDYYTSESTPGDLLIQSETTDGVTTFADSIGTYTVTGLNSAEHTTGQAKFGSSSISLQGTMALEVTYQAALDLGAQDFTFDCWLRADDFTAPQMIFECGANATAAYYLLLSGTSLYFGEYQPAVSNFFSRLHGMTVNTWHHIAVCRSGDDWRMFVDGTQIGATLSDSRTLVTPTDDMHIGQHSGAGYQLDGYIEEFRWQIGTAEWTSNFTAPIAPYSVAASDVVLQSEAFTAEAVPTEARFPAIIHEPVDSVTLNTDLVAEISRDDGTTWTATTLAKVGDYDSTKEILEAPTVDISAQPSGVAMKYRLTTANAKSQRIHAVYEQWGA